MKLPEYHVPEDELTARVIFPNGQSFRIRMPDSKTVRFVVEGQEAEMVEFYGRGKAKDAIAGFRILRDDDSTDPEVFEGDDGEWYWHKQAGNNQITRGGLQGYTRKADAIKAAERENPGEIIKVLPRS